jgi:hypothetical protein
MNAARISIPAHVHARRFDGEIVILDLERGEYFSAGDVGASIWDGLVAGSSLEDVVTRIATEYDAERDRIMADALAFVEDLRSRGLVELSEANE